MNAEIIAVGTELLLGNIVNTNAQYLSQQLAALGFTVHYQTVVGDNADRLAAVLRGAKKRSRLLLVTGGLGPTDDDLTKQTAAAVFGDELAPDTEELQRIADHFAAMGRTMTPNNAKQALVPVRGGKFTNHNGTAPGILLRDGDDLAILLPGPPGELVPMFETGVLSFLRTLQDSVLVSRWLRVVGIPESELDARLTDWLNAADPTTALYAKTGEVHIRVTAKAETEQAAAQKADATVRQLTGLLGEAVYATDDTPLEAAAVNALRNAGLHLATAESCTGGLAAQRITAVSGASDVFCGGVVSYTEDVKQRLLGVRAETLAAHTVYSAPVAHQMARGVAAAAGADIGVGITGIAGPGGALPGLPVGTVFVAVYDSRTGHSLVRRLYHPRRTRQEVRDRAATTALDMVRRLALGLSIPDAVCVTDQQ